MKSLYSSALEIAWARDKVYLAIVANKNPKNFYQLLGLHKPKFGDRVSEYLVNAAGARSIDSKSELSGLLIFMGFCERSDLPLAKALVRRAVGADNSLDVETKSLALSKGLATVTEFSMSASSVLEIKNRLHDPALDLKSLASRLRFNAPFLPGA